jgi:hypothetical protein
MERKNVMTEISREALLQLSKQGHRGEIKKLSDALGGYFRCKCEHEALEEKSRSADKKLENAENDAYNALLDICDLSRKNNAKPVLRGAGSMSRNRVLGLCIEFAEAMYRVSKEESYKK